MWAFVPSAGAILSDWGAQITKVEPMAGDPIRGLNYAGLVPGEPDGFTMMWEIFNRGKRSVAMDLNAEGAADLFYKLLEDADVFMVSLLPAARRKLKVDIDDIRSRFPNIIYAVGSGQGAHGEDAEKGGYDSISFWSRSGISSAVTPEGVEYPAAMPGGAFGDSISGSMLAGGVAAAIARRERTGESSVVDVSLLGSGMWALQPGIIAADLTGQGEMPKMSRNAVPNPLVNNYKTSEGRFVMLCMLQGQRYWPGFCRAMGCDELIEHPDFVDDASRARNIDACIAALDAVFAQKTLEECRAALATQDGQWDVIKVAGELVEDVQAIANDYVQTVDYGDDRSFKMVSAPMQFDRAASTSAPAPGLGADTDDVMKEIGLSEEDILNAKINGILL
jgi:crotonobetainyl-CoA:carnitine CoA-transferase CaiB-like acyl-CoA transferase